jgi:GNAT superfamily N-acetyltransferase
MKDKFTLIENEKLSEEDFVSFINLVSNDFVPPLLSRIDVHKYFSKINTYGRCVQCRCEGQLVGLIIFYCNNFDTDKAFVTFLAVLPEYRGMKISSILINKVCTIARDNNKIILAKSSKLAISVILNTLTITKKAEFNNVADNNADIGDGASE